LTGVEPAATPASRRRNPLRALTAHADRLTSYQTTPGWPTELTELSA
jgi:hypothetical protein